MTQPADDPKPPLSAAPAKAPALADPGLPDLGAILAALPRDGPLARMAEKSKPRATEAEETDVWWGSYSGWAMLPSWALCLLLPLVVYAGARLLGAPRGTALGWLLLLGGALVVGQLTRWCYRLFGYDYRLTTRRLYIYRGSLYRGVQRIDLERVLAVKVRRRALDHFLGVGDVLVEVDGQELAIVPGVFNPREVGKLIEATSKAALEKKPKQE